MAAALPLVVPEAPWKDGAKVADTDENVTAGYNGKRVWYAPVIEYSVIEVRQAKLGMDY